MVPPCNISYRRTCRSTGRRRRPCGTLPFRPYCACGTRSNRPSYSLCGRRNLCRRRLADCGGLLSRNRVCGWDWLGRYRRCRDADLDHRGRRCTSLGCGSTADALRQKSPNRRALYCPVLHTVKKESSSGKGDTEQEENDGSSLASTPAGIASVRVTHSMMIHTGPVATQTICCRIVDESIRSMRVINRPSTHITYTFAVAVSSSWSAASNWEGRASFPSYSMGFAIGSFRIIQSSWYESRVRHIGSTLQEDGTWV